jgi:DNA-binding response OmpR family regulator
MNGSEFLIVAEGDDACATFLCEQLAADGYPLDRARSADHAMSLCALRSPAALIAGDLGGEATAVSLVRGIRGGETAGQRVAADLPALVLSADRSQLALLRAFEARADDVIAKPFAYLELRAPRGDPAPLRPAGAQAAARGAVGA